MLYIFAFFNKFCADNHNSVKSKVVCKCCDWSLVIVS